MQRSDNIGALAAALAKAQGEMKSAAKSTENTFYKSRYADLSAVMEACRGPLSKHGIAIIQSTQYNPEGKWIETILVHSSGEWVGSHYPVKPVKDDPQGMGSAVTYARRYALMALVGIVADDDDDGNAASGKAANGNGIHAPLPPIEPVKRPVAGKPEDEARKWATEAEAMVKRFIRLEDLRSWDDRHQDHMKRLKMVDTALFDQINHTIGEQYARLNPVGAG